MGLSGSAELVLSSSVASLVVNGSALRHHLLNLKCDGLRRTRTDPMRLEKGGDRAKSPLRPWEGVL